VLPDYWIERPPLSVDPTTESAIENFLERADAADDVVEVTSLLREHAVSPWVFLCGLADRRTIAFHGTGDPDIELFEPRQPIDFAPFGHQ
jgi:hypothetical protein